MHACAQAIFLDVAGRLGCRTFGFGLQYYRQVGKEAEAGEPAKYQGNPDTILLARCLRLCKALRYGFVGWNMGIRSTKVEMMRNPEIIGQKSVVFAIVTGMYHNKAARRYQK